MVDTKTKIIFNERVAPDFFKIAFEAPEIAKKAEPGQFVMVRCSEGTNPLLRRPFSFHKIGKDNFELLYKVVGKGTEILSRRKKGDVLDVLGPLGNGFDTTRNPRLRQGFGGQARPTAHSLLIAGGYGVAPLLALAEKLTTYNLKLITFIGARTKEYILCEEDFKKLSIEVHIATEDGSKGKKGKVTDSLKGLLRSTKYEVSSIYACGPKPMLEEAAKVAKSKKIPCEVSLEEKMACGTGACLGCAVKTKKGYKMVCKDGPIFNGEDIIWK